MLDPTAKDCDTDDGRQRKSQNRVLRGGSWINDPQNLRAANRNHNSPDNRNDNVGFRLAGASEQRSGGSQNQLPDLFHCGGQTQGPRHVSKQRRQSPLAQHLPMDRLSS
jgi:hypothetical protein